MNKSKISPEVLMERQQYISSIQKITPYDSLEINDINETLAWLISAPEIHKPLNLEQHLGVICVVLSPDRKETFLLNHKKAKLWLPPGGHVDQGISFQDSVCAEMQEELNIEPKLINSDPFFLTKTLTQGLNAGHYDITVWFLVEGDPKINYFVLEKEACQSKWIKIEELLVVPEYRHLERVYKKICMHNL